jgi:hypothetical protein
LENSPVLTIERRSRKVFRRGKDLESGRAFRLFALQGRDGLRPG